MGQTVCNYRVVIWELAGWRESSHYERAMGTDSDPMIRPTKGKERMSSRNRAKDIKVKELEHKGSDGP